MDTKYTSDGRKVIVVGKLNAEQHIVQEIFICDGQEVPSGKNFVVSSLHDAPAESWKEKSLRELEERYDKTRKNIEKRIDEVKNHLGTAEDKAKQKAAALLAFAKNSDSEQLRTLHAFLAGEITHFFIDNYAPEIVSWNDNTIYQTDSWGSRLKIEGMKLVSLVGRSDGHLDYFLNTYSDGSGGRTRIVPCANYEDALSIAQEALNIKAELYVSGDIKSFSLDRWSKIEEIKVPADAQKKYDAEKLEKQLARVEKLRTEIATINMEIEGP